MASKQPTPITAHTEARFFAMQVANELQRLYEAHRVPETWGSPSVSRYVFAALRYHGVWAAGRELTRRISKTGFPGLSTAEKITALLVGIGLVIIADCLFLQKEPISGTHSIARHWTPSPPTFALTLYTFGAALLVAANGSGSPEGGTLHYPGSDTSTDYRAFGRPDETDGAREIYDTDAFDDLDEEDTHKPGGN